MVRINKIYTKTGDDGTTGLVDGSRVKKNHPRVIAYGELDELMSHIGLAKDFATESNLNEIVKKLDLIQNELFDIGSYLATPTGFDKYQVFEVKEEHILRLEGWIDIVTESLPPLTSFILPGGHKLNSAFHITRAVARRAERAVITLNESEEIGKNVIIYLNRLSDLFFALSRGVCKELGVKESLWVVWNEREGTSLK